MRLIKQIAFFSLGGLILLINVAALYFVICTALVKSGNFDYWAYKPDGKTRYKIVVGPQIKPTKSGHGWATKKYIPKHCTEMLFIAEDPGFYEHRGIEFAAMRLALAQNIEKRKYKYGASTITQQLVKNLFLWRNKTIFRKSLEIMGAVILDMMMSKNEQLEWYLNIVELGPNIYGIKQAAKIYFHKSVPELNPRECLILIGSLTEPKKVYRLISQNRFDIHKYRKTRILMNIYLQRHPEMGNFFTKNGR